MFVLQQTVGTVPFPPRAGKGDTSESEVARGETLEEFMVALFAKLCAGKDRRERDDLHEDLQEWFVWGEAKAKHAAAREAYGFADLKLVKPELPPLSECLVAGEPFRPRIKFIEPEQAGRGDEPHVVEGE